MKLHKPSSPSTTRMLQPLLLVSRTYYEMMYISWQQREARAEMRLGLIKFAFQILRNDISLECDAPIRPALHCRPERM